MSANNVWSKIVSSLNQTAIDIKTVPSNKSAPIWFSAFAKDGDVFVQKSISQSPSSQLSQRRKITKTEFEKVYPYYHRCLRGEMNLSQEIRKITLNKSYIFALTAHFE